MLQRPFSRSPVARHAVPFAVRSTAGARHEVARNGSDHFWAIRWLGEQGMGWLGHPVSSSDRANGSQPRRTYDGITGLYLDSSAHNSCCCSRKAR